MRQFRRFATAVCAVGMLVQLLLTTYYLGMGHKAAPHDLPVGLIAGAGRREPIATKLEAGGTFAVAGFASADALLTAIKRREVHAAIGCLIVLITNILPNRTERTSEVDLGL